MNYPAPPPVKLHSPAALFAIEAHKDQLYGRKPYDFHLTQVAMNYPRFRDWDELRQSVMDACWLHDYLEDCCPPDLTRTYSWPESPEYVAQYEGVKRLLGMFEEETAGLVVAVTNNHDTKKPNYSFIRNTSGALTVKLCDRIANVENCVSYKRLGRKPHRLYAKYVKAWPDFQAELRGRCRGEGAAEAFMWEQLDMLLSGAKGPFE